MHSYVQDNKQFQYYFLMRDNKPFTQKEDQVIRDLYENQNIKKWSMIARTLTEEYNYPRNAKQCRDRYQQYLDPMMVSEWTPEEQQKLYALHNQIGNKWAVIAQKFPGRTDNCVKNHFYAKLRKSLRHLNKIIKQNFKKEFKELKIGAIYKIIEALEDRFNENTMIQQQIFNKCLRLKKQLLEYSDKQNDCSEGDLQKQKQLIREVVQFSRNYKRKTKKERRNSLNGVQLFKHSTLQKRIKYSSDQESSESQYSLVQSVQSASQKQQASQNNSQESEIALNVIEQDIRQSITSNININIRQSTNSNIKQSKNQRYRSNLLLTQKVQMQDEGKNDLKFSYKSNQHSNIQQVLRQKNLLEEIQVSFVGLKLSNSNFSASVKSQSEKPDMFDDSLRISQGFRNIQQVDQQSPEQSIFLSYQGHKDK